MAEDGKQVDGMVHTECLEHSGGKAKGRRNSGANGPKTAKGSSRKLGNQRAPLPHGAELPKELNPFFTAVTPS